MRHKARGAGGHLLQRLHNERSAQCGQAVVQLAGGLALANRGNGFQHHGAGIEPRFHAHDAHSSVGIPSFDRTVNGRRTAPARQLRAMNVQTTVQRHRQHGRRQQQAIGHHDHPVGRESRQFRRRLCRAQSGRLQHGQAVRYSGGFHGRRLQLPPTARRTIRLRVDRHHLVRSSAKRFKRRHREHRRAGKDDTHVGYSARARRDFSSLLRIRPRFSSER